MRIEDLTCTEKEWVFYEEQLRHVKAHMMQFDWSYFLTIRRGCKGQFDAFTGRDDVGYNTRTKDTKTLLYEIRSQLGFRNNKHFHYYAVHEFGESGFGHVHAVFHSTKEVSECAVESVLRELAEVERKKGFQIHYDPPEKYKKKYKADIKIRSKEKVCEYMTKVEKVNGCYRPLFKQAWPSNFLVKR